MQAGMGTECRWGKSLMAAMGEERPDGDYPFCLPKSLTLVPYPQTHGRL